MMVPFLVLLVLQVTRPKWPLLLLMIVPHKIECYLDVSHVQFAVSINRSASAVQFVDKFSFTHPITELQSQRFISC